MIQLGSNSQDSNLDISNFKARELTHDALIPATAGEQSPPVFTLLNVLHLARVNFSTFPFVPLLGLQMQRPNWEKVYGSKLLCLTQLKKVRMPGCLLVQFFIGTQILDLPPSL